LVCHYGLSAEELDFPPSLKLWRTGVVNCDTHLHQGFGGQVKYRLGLSAVADHSAEEEE
jgi:hypothetical protein